MIWFIIFIVFSFVAGMMAMTKTPVSGWLKSQSEEMLCFGPPKAVRVWNRVMALAWLGLAVGIIQAVDWSGTLFIRLLAIPVLVFIIRFCLYMAGSRMVSIDLAQRTVQKAGGWLVYPKKRNYPLTEMSAIYIYGGRGHCSIALWVAGIGGPRFPLGDANNGDEAMDFAQKVGTLSHLPVRETTVAAMRSQMSARKRS